MERGGLLRSNLFCPAQTAVRRTRDLRTLPYLISEPVVGKPPLARGRLQSAVEAIVDQVVDDAWIGQRRGIAEIVEFGKPSFE